MDTETILFAAFKALINSTEQNPVKFQEICKKVHETIGHVGFTEGQLSLILQEYCKSTPHYQNKKSTNPNLFFTPKRGWWYKAPDITDETLHSVFTEEHYNEIFYPQEESLVDIFKREYESGEYDQIEARQKELYKEFQSKYSPDILYSLDDDTLLKRLHSSEGNHDNLWYILEKNKEFWDLFGAMRLGNLNRVMVYYSSDQGAWVKSLSGSSKNKEKIKLSEAKTSAKNEIAANFKKAYDTITNFIHDKEIDDIDYTKLDNQLKTQLADFTPYNKNYQWLRKYFHLVFPDIFPTFYSENMLKDVANHIDGSASENLWENMEKIVKFAKTCGIPNAVFAKIAGKIWNLKEQEEETIDKTSEKNTNNNANIEFPLNQILYGAPGTGKTYSTVIKAMEIIDNKKYDKVDDNLYNELHERFNELKEEGQIEFVTFHQSMSYEDFVEGIKPETQDNNVVYEVKDGIFKEISKRAAMKTVVSNNQEIDFSKAGIFKMSLGSGINNDIFNYCTTNNVIALGYAKEIDATDLQTREEIVEAINNSSLNNQTKFNIDALVRFKLWMKKGDIVLISNGTREIVAIAQITGDYQYNTDTPIDYQHFRTVKWLYQGNIPVKTISETNLSQQCIYAFFDPKKTRNDLSYQNINTQKLNNLITATNHDIDNQNKKYVLIIDEINRGNISKIFGELITLLEPSKRIGNNEELRLTLPYSANKEEKFGVPNNLYIIGTMNTSDRSIAAIDIALRRRFTFIPMRPKDTLVQDKFGIRLHDIFTTINTKIEILLDEDHKIGHSYFMNKKCTSLETLKQTWFYEIMPLINEYFYGDWENLRFILKDFVKEIPDAKSILGELSKNFDGDKFYKFTTIEDFSNDQYFITTMNNLIKNN